MQNRGLPLAAPAPRGIPGKRFLAQSYGIPCTTVVLRTYRVKPRSFSPGIKNGPVLLRILQVGGPLCPFAAMACYLADRAPIRTPIHTSLFSFASGRPLTRTSCLAHLRHLLLKAQYPPKAFNTHSFRIGATTAVAQAGVSTATIKCLGRWCSSVYRRYIHPPPPPGTTACLRTHGPASPAATLTLVAWLHQLPL